MEQPKFGKKVLELRLSKGLTQTELSEKCNISLRTVQRIESAQVNPRSHTIKTIFAALDFDFYKSKSKEGNQFSGTLKSLLNFKVNTMKKITFLSISLIAAATLVFLLNSKSAHSQSIEGWFKAGNKSGSYEIGLDTVVYRTGSGSAFIQSTEEVIDGFGTIMQASKAQGYLGKRVKMTGFLKTENVTNWAGMWLRIDSNKPVEMLSFDNMGKRPLKGNTDWKKCEIILDVPQNSAKMSYGVLLSGTGKVWFDKITFEVVDKNKTKTTDNSLPDKPLNTDF